MLKTKSLTKVLEERVSQDEALQEKYVELINTLNTFSDATMNWLGEQEVDFPLKATITDELLKRKMFRSYIVGKTLYLKSFIYVWYTNIIKSIVFGVLIEDLSKIVLC